MEKNLLTMIKLFREDSTTHIRIKRDQKINLSTRVKFKPNLKFMSNK